MSDRIIIETVDVVTEENVEIENVVSSNEIVDVTHTEFETIEVIEKGAKGDPGEDFDATNNYNWSGDNVFNGEVEINTDAKFNSVGSIKIPVGMTSERPTATTQGQLRYNTTNDELELFNGSNWLPVGNDSNSKSSYVTLTNNGNNGIVLNDSRVTTITEDVQPFEEGSDYYTCVVYNDSEVTSTITGESEQYVPGDMLVWDLTSWRHINCDDNIVKSFNGRVGNVTPQAGDYSIDMISNSLQTSNDETITGVWDYSNGLDISQLNIRNNTINSTTDITLNSTITIGQDIITFNIGSDNYTIDNDGLNINKVTSTEYKYNSGSRTTFDDTFTIEDSSNRGISFDINNDNTTVNTTSNYLKFNTPIELDSVNVTDNSFIGTSLNRLSNLFSSAIDTLAINTVRVDSTLTVSETSNITTANITDLFIQNSLNFNSSVDINTQGDITANNFIGDGSQLTGTIVHESMEVRTSNGLTGGGDLSEIRTIELDESDNRNVDHSSITISGGSGLSGSGSIDSNIELTLDNTNSRNVDHDNIEIRTVNGLTGGGNISSTITIQPQFKPNGALASDSSGIYIDSDNTQLAETTEFGSTVLMYDQNGNVKKIKVENLLQEASGGLNIRGTVNLDAGENTCDIVDNTHGEVFNVSASNLPEWIGSGDAFIVVNETQVENSITGTNLTWFKGNTLIYLENPNTTVWNQLSSGVQSFNGRVGNVAPQKADYSQFFIDTTNNYTITGDWSFSNQVTFNGLNSNTGTITTFNTNLISLTNSKVTSSTENLLDIKNNSNESKLTLSNDGGITATSFVGDGSGLTGTVLHSDSDETITGVYTFNGNIVGNTNVNIGAGGRFGTIYASGLNLSGNIDGVNIANANEFIGDGSGLTGTVLHSDGTQTITGLKTFENDIILDNDNIIKSKSSTDVILDVLGVDLNNLLNVGNNAINTILKSLNTPIWNKDSVDYKFAFLNIEQTWQNIQKFVQGISINNNTSLSSKNTNGDDRNLINLDSTNNVNVGDVLIQTNINSLNRPTINFGGSTYSVAKLGDNISNFVNNSNYLQSDSSGNVSNTYNFTSSSNTFVGNGSGLTNLPLNNNVKVFGVNDNNEYRIPGSVGTGGTELRAQTTPTMTINPSLGRITATSFVGNGSGLTDLPQQDLVPVSNNNYLQGENTSGDVYDMIGVSSSNVVAISPVVTAKLVSRYTFGTSGVTFTRSLNMGGNAITNTGNLASTSNGADIGSSDRPYQNIYGDDFYGNGSQLTQVNAQTVQGLSFFEAGVNGFSEERLVKLSESTGTLEIGKYLDFHDTNNGTDTNYDVRFNAIRNATFNYSKLLGSVQNTSNEDVSGQVGIFIQATDEADAIAKSTATPGAIYFW